MASSSSTTPVSLPLQPNTGEGLETPSMVPAVSTEAMVDAAVALPTIPGEATPTTPSSISDETENLREGFVFPLIDPWYGSSPLFLPRALAFSFLVDDWDWTVSGLEVAVDQGWVPNFDEISELLIQKGDLQADPSISTFSTLHPRIGPIGWTGKSLIMISGIVCGTLVSIGPY